MYVLFYLISILIVLCGILSTILYMESCNTLEPFSNSQIPVFYINLDRSVDRNARMKTQLKKYFNNFQRISAVDGSALSPNVLKNKINIDNTIDLSYDFTELKQSHDRGNITSVVGCTLSHIKTILLINEMGYENAIIIEDDTDLQYMPKWDTTIKKIIDEAPRDWEIIKLFTSNEQKQQEDIKLFQNGINYRKLPQNNIKKEHSTGFYIINKRGISKILEDINNNEFKLHKNKYERFTADYYIYKHKNAYEYTKPLVSPFYDNKSTIDKEGVNSSDKRCALFLKDFYSSK